MRETRWLFWLSIAIIPICEPSELSIQAQLNQLTKRVSSLEDEVKSLKVNHWLKHRHMQMNFRIHGLGYSLQEKNIRLLRELFIFKICDHRRHNIDNLIH